jgi:diguanylate cyclase (GGDEF)-like protein
MKYSLSAIALICILVVPFTDSLWLDSVLALIAVCCVAFVITTNKSNLLPFLMLLSATPIVPFVKWFEPAFEKQSTEVAFQALNNELDIAENTINQFFQNNASALESISVLISHETDIENALYQEWLMQILPPHRNQFFNVALSRNLVITNVYPENEANLKVKNVDLGTVPGQGLLYRNSAVTRQNIVIGPVQLIQGVPGIIYVRPVAGNDNLIVSGVLSLQYLKDDLEILLSNQVDLSVNISTVALDFQLMDNNRHTNDRSVNRILRFDEIEVELSASSTQIDELIFRTQTITRLSAFTFWLAISLVLSWQHMNFRIRDKQRRALQKSESELNSAQRLGKMGSWASSDNKCLSVSEALQELLHIDSNEISFEQFFDLLHPDSKVQYRELIDSFLKGSKSEFSLEHQLKTDDQYRWFEHRIARGTNNRCTGILRDIHTLRKRDEQVAKLESFDTLTGAANRHYFKQLAVQNIALCERRRSTIALALINIDDFRSINEKHGQLSGDELLKQVTHRLQTTSRKSDTIARLSGDTFAISLVDIGKNKQSVLVIEQILRRLKEPYILSEDVYPQFTMGVSMYPDDGKDYDTLLRMAESALNTAKSDSRGHYRYYSAKLSEQTDRRQQILASLPSAIRNDYLSLVFQPRVSSDRVAHAGSMEALIRWNDPVLGFVSPGEFIPIAEQTSLIADIGYWVMENVFIIISDNRESLPDNIVVSINLSPRQLEDPTLVKNVDDLLKKYSVNAAQFELEITEYSISEESEAIIRNMKELSSMGFQFALDDFGTGYSNLGILQSLPLNVLKVDMSFIRAIGTTEKSDELVRAILNMGHTLGLRVVAEGVESAAQVQFLRDLKCEELQGYYFFKPAPIEDLLPSLKPARLT